MRQVLLPAARHEPPGCERRAPRARACDAGARPRPKPGAAARAARRLQPRGRDVSCFHGFFITGVPVDASRVVLEGAFPPAVCCARPIAKSCTSNSLSHTHYPHTGTCALMRWRALWRITAATARLQRATWRRRRAAGRSCRWGAAGGCRAAVCDRLLLSLTRPHQRLAGPKLPLTLVTQPGFLSHPTYAFFAGPCRVPGHAV